MTRSEIEAILAGTKGVTPGPWANGLDKPRTEIGRVVALVSSASDIVPIAAVPIGVDLYVSANGEANAAHIARLDPQTVSALCTALLESMDRVEAAELGLAAAVQIAGEAAEEWDKAPEGMRAGKILLALAGRRPRYRPDTDAIHAVLAARKSLGGSNGGR